jgi:putative ABC transport system permease protein
MYHLALKMLVADRAKYVMLVGGLAFASLLMTQQNGVFRGLLSWTTSHMRNMRASIWVVEKNVEQVNETKAMRDTDVNRVRSVTGVDFAVPLYLSVQKARAADGSDKPVQLVGLHGATLIGRPPVVLRGDLEQLRLPNAVFIDELAVQRLSAGRTRPLDIGDTFEINDREARVVGICRTERQFFGYPYVFTTYDQALQYAPRQRKMLSMILAEPKPGSTAAEVARLIERETGLRAFTVPEFSVATIDFIWRNTGIPASFLTTIILGFIVGIAVSAQTFYSFVLENLRNLGALKAMGASNGLLARLLLLQAFTVGVIGYGIGVGLTAVFGFAVLPIGQPPFILDYASLTLTGAAVIFICLFAALLGILKVSRLEAAIVFRA